MAFDRYAVDLSAFNQDGGEIVYKPRERGTTQLLFPDKNDAFYKFQEGRFRAELHDRLSSWLYPLAMMAIAFAALGDPRTTRQGRGVAMAAAVVAVVVLRIAGFAASSAVVRTPWAAIGVYGAPLLAIVVSLMLILQGSVIRKARARLGGLGTGAAAVPHVQTAESLIMIIGATLGGYFSRQFLKTIFLVFATVFSLVYTLDFVELMRRAGDAENASAGLMAQLALFRTPVIAEQVMPFAVLFGSMAALLQLSRKLELVIARAAGVSAWQFLQPGLFVALIIGIASVAVYNPISAMLKQRAADLETRIFSRTLQTSGKPIWLRQRSLDGQAIFRADGAINDTTTITGVTVYHLHECGRFHPANRSPGSHPAPGLLVPQERPHSHRDGAPADLRPIRDRVESRALAGPAELHRAGRGPLLESEADHRAVAEGRPQRQRLPVALQRAPRPPLAVHRHGPGGRFRFIKILSIWRRGHDGSGWRGCRLHALCRH